MSVISRSNSAAGAGLAKASELGFMVVEKAAAERIEKEVGAIEALLTILAVLRRRERWPTMFLEQVRRKVRLSGEDIDAQSPPKNACIGIVSRLRNKGEEREKEAQEDDCSPWSFFAPADDPIAPAMPSVDPALQVLHDLPGRLPRYRGGQREEKHRTESDVDDIANGFEPCLVLGPGG